jgi:hypothetical protein
MEDFNDLEDDDEVENLASRLAKRPAAGNGLLDCLLGGCAIAPNKTCQLMVVSLTLLH